MTDALRPERPLGKTGVTVPLIGYGTAPLGEDNVSMEEAVASIRRAVELGVTYIDTSPDYGSEPKVGEALQGRRADVFLATKVNRRSRDGARRELEESLTRLKTDHVDLVQIHAVNAWADLQEALAPDGAIAALEEARRQGLTRFIGITGHARPEILGHAITMHPFDTVLCALGMGDRLVTSPETFMLPRASEREMGVIAMKVFGHGHYENREACLRYTLGLKGVSLAILGMDNVQQVETNVRLAARYRPLEEHEEAHLIEEVRPVVEKDAQDSQEGKSDLFWLHDTTVMGWSTHDEPARPRY